MGKQKRSNTSKGPADKGSKHWMQKIVNTELKPKLDESIGLGEIKWLSPLKKDNYKEYRLNKELAGELHIPPAALAFWPQVRPQWDAIGETEQYIIIVEAKAHVGEMESKPSHATNSDSIALIEKSMREVHDKYYPSDKYDFWENKYYQFANRLTFLHKLNESADLKKKFKLVFLNIINDITYKPTVEDKFKARFNDMTANMTGLKELGSDIIVRYFDAQLEEFIS